ncbi:hypothetical protein [Paenibacillus polymyxa]|uniref:hypothetical protein n=1 Tax=Paenibacillus polymyxa TaxID=1406 RepID=UPI002AB5A078|nr:hypothetical protein [Paenibacillus polymyxa]MDY8025815.1 hypothetical protein [Paenibacillus polymyxa]
MDCCLLHKQASKKICHFISNIEKQFQTISRPLVYDMEAILDENNKQIKSDKFIKFMQKIDSNESPLILEYDYATLKSHTRLCNFYKYHYKSDPNEEKFNYLWACFGDFYENVFKDLNRRWYILHKHYSWFDRMEHMGLFNRVTHEAFKLLFDLCIFMFKFSLQLWIPIIAVYFIKKFDTGRIYELIMQTVIPLLYFSFIMASVCFLLWILDIILFHYKTEPNKDFHTIHYKDELELEPWQIARYINKFPYNVDYSEQNKASKPPESKDQSLRDSD